MSVASRPVSTGKTRTCPHCKATILESLSICPGCLHHLRFDQEAAKRQGPHRFARGHHYLEVAKREADRLGVPLAWRLAIAPGVAHDNSAMAPHVGRELFGA